MKPRSAMPAPAQAQAGAQRGASAAPAPASVTARLSAAEREALGAELWAGLQFTVEDIMRGMKRDLALLEVTGDWSGAAAFNWRLYRLRVMARELWPDLPKVARPPRLAG